jgi:hypothetical protein
MRRRKKPSRAPKIWSVRLRSEAHREARSILRIAPNQKFSNQIMHLVLNTGLRTCFEKFLDFFDSEMLQLFESDRVLFDQLDSRDREAL